MASAMGIKPIATGNKLIFDELITDSDGFYTHRGGGLR